MFPLMIALFFVGLIIGALWGIYVYPRLAAVDDGQYAIQYKEGEWLWLKDAAKREVLVFAGQAAAHGALDQWLRQNPEYIGHSRIVPWKPLPGAAARSAAEQNAEAER